MPRTFTKSWSLVVSAMVGAEASGGSAGHRVCLGSSLSLSGCSTLPSQWARPMEPPRPQIGCQSRASRQCKTRVSMVSSGQRGPESGASCEDGRLAQSKRLKPPCDCEGSYCVNVDRVDLSPGRRCLTALCGSFSIVKSLPQIAREWE